MLLWPAMSAAVSLSSVMPVYMAYKQGNRITVTTCLQCLLMLRQCLLAAGALNFKDVMLAIRQAGQEPHGQGLLPGLLGFEFSGTALCGRERRVMGVARRALAT